MEAGNSWRRHVQFIICNLLFAFANKPQPRPLLHSTAQRVHTSGLRRFSLAMCQDWVENYRESQMELRHSARKSEYHASYHDELYSFLRPAE